MAALGKRPIARDTLLKLARRGDVRLYTLEGFYHASVPLPGLMLGYRAIDSARYRPVAGPDARHSDADGVSRSAICWPASARTTCRHLPRPFPTAFVSPYGQGRPPASTTIKLMRYGLCSLLPWLFLSGEDFR